MIRSLSLKLLHIYVAFSVMLFLWVQSLKYYTIEAPKFIFHYLNDFLTIPIVATISLHAVWFIKKDKTIRLPLFSILSLVALYSIFFEYYLPQQSPRYTGDIWDVVSYFLGGTAFYFLQKIE